MPGLSRIARMQNSSCFSDGPAVLFSSEGDVKEPVPRMTAMFLPAHSSVVASHQQSVPSHCPRHTRRNKRQSVEMPLRVLSHAIPRSAPIAGDGHHPVPSDKTAMSCGRKINVAQSRGHPGWQRLPVISSVVCRQQRAFHSASPAVQFVEEGHAMQTMRPNGRNDRPFASRSVKIEL